MKYASSRALLGAALVLVCQRPTTARAHGFVGDRFFPATITTDDPLVTDELALPSLSLFPDPAGDGSPETRSLTAGFEFDKLIIPKLALGISDDYIWQQPKGAPSARGWDNLTLSIKYEVWRNVPHEAVVSVGLLTDLGGTGSRSIGRDPYTTFTPTLYFGKGFGDLPDSLAGLQSLALTGTIGQTLPTSAVQCSLQWGLALEYNLQYLQQHVKNLGIPAPFKDMIPLVEFAMSTAENRGPLGVTTGTINPGVLWESRYLQVGVEMLIPVNSASGRHLGAALTIDIYIDDLFPKIFGHPIFGD